MCTLHGKTDLRRKRFVINMQLRQCFARAKPIRLKISLKKVRFFWLFVFPKKGKGVQKKPELQNLASKKANWQRCYARIENAHKVHKETLNSVLCIQIQKT